MVSSQLHRKLWRAVVVCCVGDSGTVAGVMHMNLNSMCLLLRRVLTSIVEFEVGNIIGFETLGDKENKNKNTTSRHGHFFRYQNQCVVS